MSSEAGSSSITVRVAPEEKYKKHYVFKFNGSLGIDPAAWHKANEISIKRDETNKAVYDDAGLKQDYGAGSEYGKAQREIARRKRMGHRMKYYDIDAQPWVLNLRQNAKDQMRRYRCTQEAGAGAYADNWIFRKNPDGTFEAYNAVPIARHRTLNIDEAEEQFTRRAKLLNKFALRAQMLGDEADSNDAVAAELKPDATGAKMNTRSTHETQKISDRDDYKSGSGSDDEPSEKKPDVADVDAEVSDKKKKPGRKTKKVVDLENDINDVAALESEDGDEEGLEQDYMSDSGSEPSLPVDALEQKLRETGELGADEVGRDEGENSESGSDENDDAEKEEDEQEKKRSASEWQAKNELEQRRASDESASDSDDPDKADVNSPLFLKKREGGSAQSSSKGGAAAEKNLPSVAEVVAVKRAASNKELSADGQPKAKKAKEDSRPSSVAKTSNEPGIEHDDYMRNLLKRKPHSTKELLHKLKLRSPGMSKTEMVTLLAEILKRLKPVQTPTDVKGRSTLMFSL